MDDAYGRVLVRALRRELTDLPSGLKQDRLIWRACEHGLAGLVAQAVDGRGPTGSPLRQVAEKLGAVARVQEGWTDNHLRHAVEIANVLREHEVPAVFFKGVAMALAHYEEAGLRAFGDLDLLVAPPDLPRARRALAAAGFAPNPSIRPNAMAEGFCLPQATPLSSAVDLHWDLAESDGFLAAIRIPPGEIISRARRIRGVPIPCDEDALLLSAINLVRSRVDRVVLVVDMVRLSAAIGDWTPVLDRASAWKLKTSLWLGLTLAVRLFAAPVPADVLRSIAPAAWRRGLLLGLLEGPSLWLRRKIRHRFLVHALPPLCLDSAADFLWGLRSSGRKALRPHRR